jgi:RNA polymerase sigma factor (sigma-70 family)
MRIGRGSFAASTEYFLNSAWRKEYVRIAYTVAAKKRMAEISLSAVDIEEVLNRLALHAQSLSAGPMCLGLDEIAFPGGDSAKDLASTTLLKFLDPKDTTVKWSETKAQPTTATLLAYLRKVLERDLLDLIRSKRHQNTVYVETTESGGEKEDEKRGVTLDQLAVAFETPEGQTLKRERVEWILKQFDAEPELKEIVKLQLDPEGYNAFTNQELAALLDTTLEDIENRKKRIKRKLRNLALSHGLQAKHV